MGGARSPPPGPHGACSLPQGCSIVFLPGAAPQAPRTQGLSWGQVTEALCLCPPGKAGSPGPCGSHEECRLREHVGAKFRCQLGSAAPGPLTVSLHVGPSLLAADNSPASRQGQEAVCIKVLTLRVSPVCPSSLERETALSTLSEVETKESLPPPVTDISAQQLRIPRGTGDGPVSPPTVQCLQRDAQTFGENSLPPLPVGACVCTQPVGVKSRLPAHGDPSGRKPALGQTAVCPEASVGSCWGTTP